MFSGEEQMKPVAGLSGGERSRVALAKLLLRPCNLLLLDEPTNHLDVATRERLEETLSEYPGTLMFVTHDRYLVDRLATKVVEVADGGITIYPGNYADYRRARAAAAQAAAAPVVVEAVPERPAVEQRPMGRDPREQRRLSAAVRDLERQIGEAEQELRDVEDRLSNPAEHVDDLAALSVRHAELAAAVMRLTEQWEALALELEGAA
jgi:ATP-binding cassette, subfamily F, member 3